MLHILLAAAIVSAPGQVDFETQVMPLLTQAGCNAAVPYARTGLMGLIFRRY